MSNFTDDRLISKVLYYGEKEDRENKLGKLCKKLSPEREKEILEVCLDLFLLSQEKGTVIRRNLYKEEWILSLWKLKNNGNDLLLILL